MRLMIVLLAAVTLVAAGRPLCASQEEKAPEPQMRTLVRSGDSLSGTALVITAKVVRFKTAYSGTVELDRRAVAGIVLAGAHDQEVLETGAQSDTLYLTSGDKVSGEILETDEGKLVVKAVYLGGNETRIALDKIEYFTFAPATGDEKLELAPDPVRVIFANGDLVGGRLVSFKSGTFRLETQYAGTLRFGTDEIQSLHNTTKSRQIFPRGLAEAFMELFEKSRALRDQHRNILPPLVRGFLDQGDVAGAIYIFERMAPYNVDPYTYEQLANAFEAAKQGEAAIQAYERMYKDRRNNPRVFERLFRAYKKHGRYARAAEVYEELLKQPATTLASYGHQEAKIRMDLVEVYTKLEAHDKTIAHLRKVIEDPSARDSTRHRARTALVESFKKVGRLEELVERYSAEVTALDTELGTRYVALVAEYIDRGKLTKARAQVKRLEQLGLDEHAAQAKALIEQAAPPDTQRDPQNSESEDQPDG